jgi:choline monooxygenase|tara:strand:- start:795 stop:1940 length:1146 start_codon:yes stop_codon:yes gene_type:complete
MQNALNVEEILIQLKDASEAKPKDAQMLHPSYYHSKELYELEKEHIFSKEWICMARVEQIPNPGDYVTVCLLDEPIVIVRQQDGSIQALSNVCRHRYFPVAQGQGNTRFFACPYHKWTYQLDGSLMGAPGMKDSSFDQSKCQLPEFRSEVWMGFIFVNLDITAEPLAPRLASLTERLTEYQLDQWRAPCIFEERWAGNWKLACENALDSYHHMGLHENSVQSIMPGLGTEFVEAHDAWNYHRTPFNERGITEANERAPEVVARLAEHDAFTMNAIFIYPNLVIPLLPTGANWLSFVPDAIDRTWIFTGLALDNSMLSQVEDEVAFGVVVKEALSGINQEDSLGTSELQKTTRSAFIERGPICEKELGVLHYYKYLARRLVN